MSELLKGLGTSLNDFGATSFKLLGKLYRHSTHVCLLYCGCGGHGLGQGLKMSELEVELSLDGDVHGTLPQLLQYQPSGPWIQGPPDWEARLEGGPAAWILHFP